MPLVEFTANLARQIDAPARRVQATTVREALQAVFHELPKLRGYILDDQGEVRTHVVIFVDGKSIKDRRHLTDPVLAESELFVMQALSGG